MIESSFVPITCKRTVGARLECKASFVQTLRMVKHVCHRSNAPAEARFDSLRATSQNNEAIVTNVLTMFEQAL